MLFNVIGYSGVIIGQVEASDIVEAWSKAGKKFENILDVRLSGEYEGSSIRKQSDTKSYFVYGFDGQLVGDVRDAIDITDAWDKARIKFGEVSDVREVQEVVREFGARVRLPEWKRQERLAQYGKSEGKGWIKMEFTPIVNEEIGAFWYRANGAPIGSDAIRWENDFPHDIAVVTLFSEIVEDLRDGLEPEEYLGIIDVGNIVVMAGDEDGYHYIKVFPDRDAALIEAGRLIKRFSDFYEMEEAGRFNGYLALSRGGA